MKAFLVVDIPDDLMVEECDIDYQVYYSNENADSFLVEESTAMTLRPLPQKREPKEEWLNEYHRDEFADGWNACLDEILGDCITQEEADLCGVQLWHDD